MTTMDAPVQRPLGDLFGDLARETSTLVRSEVELAKTELSEKASEAGHDAIMVGAGGLLAHAALLFVLGAIAVLLRGVIPLWISTLLVGLVSGAIGWVMIQKGIDALRRIDPKPEETVRTMKEDVQWARNRLGR